MAKNKIKIWVLRQAIVMKVSMVKSKISKTIKINQKNTNQNNIKVKINVNINIMIKINNFNKLNKIMD